MSWKYTLSMKGIEILDIMYIYVLATIFSLIIGSLIGFFLKFNKSDYKNNNKDRMRLLGSILIDFCLIGVAFYVIRLLVKLCPFPLSGFNGIDPPINPIVYDHTQLEEYKSPYPIVFIVILLLGNTISAKILHLKDLYYDVANGIISK